MHCIVCLQPSVRSSSMLLEQTWVSSTCFNRVKCLFSAQYVQWLVCGRSIGHATGDDGGASYCCRWAHLREDRHSALAARQQPIPSDWGQAPPHPACSQCPGQVCSWPTCTPDKSSLKCQVLPANHACYSSTLAMRKALGNGHR